MPRRASFVTLLTLLERRFPDLIHAALIKEGAVLVDGVPAASIRARIRADAAVQIRRPRPLRGTIKLAHALAGFDISAGGVVALDLGAAAGGFTQALLDAGAARVYAVDAGVGQLRGWLRADPRVINLERTNLAQLSPRLIGQPVDLITMDLSYLSVAGAISQLDTRLMAPAAQLIALVKPTFELRAAALAERPEQVAAAADAAARALERHGWQVRGQLPSAIRGAKGRSRYSCMQPSNFALLSRGLAALIMGTCGSSCRRRGSCCASSQRATQTTSSTSTVTPR